MRAAAALPPSDANSEASSAWAAAREEAEGPLEGRKPGAAEDAEEASPTRSVQTSGDARAQEPTKAAGARSRKRRSPITPSRSGSAHYSSAAKGQAPRAPNKLPTTSQKSASKCDASWHRVAE